MEIRIHGRGGQGGVTAAKILAALYAHHGKSVQAFGDYAAERSGAPVRAYARIDDLEVTSRNKVYNPDHLIVLDEGLIDSGVLAGLAPGGTLLINSTKDPSSLVELFPGHFIATIDATGIARKHGIGTKSVLIVNTTMAGAYARLFELPFETIEAVYEDLGLAGDLEAAQDGWNQVRWSEAVGEARPATLAPATPAPVMELIDHQVGPRPALKTGAWRSLLPLYFSPTAPCVSSCPAGNDVVGFIQALATKGEEAAAEILAQTTPLPGVCGRVCPGFCMEGCTRVDLDGAVNVRALERWVADHAVIARAAPESERVDEAKARSIAIVGSGPAGLSAAYALARIGHRVVIFEADATPGGILANGIPEYRLPSDVVGAEIEALVGLGVEICCDTRIDDPQALLESSFDAVILATGLQVPREVGGSLPGIEQGLDYLRRVKDEIPVMSGHVVVVGGGNTAIDCARTAVRCGASRVTVAYRRSLEEMPAIKEEIDAAIEEGVEMLLLRSPAGFEGGRSVAAIRLAEVELGEPDSSGRRRPITTDRHTTLECDAVLLALGTSADTSIVGDEATLRESRVWRDDHETMVFACGDLATWDGTVVHAIGDGRRIAGKVLEALGVDAPIEVVESNVPTRLVSSLAMRLDTFARADQAIEDIEGPAERILNFDEMHHGLASPSEAIRCLSCGHCTMCDTCLFACPEGVIKRTEDGYEIDLEYCKGCGICVTECPRDGMEMVNP